MRFPALLVLILGLAGALFAQGTPGDAQGATKKSLFASVKPDAMVVVRRLPAGTDEIRITMLDPEFTEQDLRAIVQAISERSGSASAGVLIFQEPLGGSPALMATFALPEIIVSNPPGFRIDPIAKGFLDAAADQVEAIGIIFESQSPKPATLRSYESENVRVESTQHDGRIGLEYRISFDNKDPNSFTIPDRVENKPITVDKSNRTGGLDLSMFGIVAVSALALGALVYCLLLWGRGPARR